MLQHSTPEDFVIATGEMHTVREFCTIAFQEAGIELEWQGNGIDEKGLCKKTGKVIIEIDPIYYRPTEVELLCGNPSKAKSLLGWNPLKTPFVSLIKKMVSTDFEYIRKN
jgi:GDPmannose 4,6-dehydratase